VKQVTDRYAVPLIIDDRVDIALASDAAGVHVGAEDLPVSEARRLMGPDKIVGATAKTVQRATEAQAQGADYLGVGAIYPTTTKVVTIITEVSTLKDICRRVDIPVCAIGGLNPTNCDVLAGSGIAGICVVSAIMKSDHPKAAAQALRQKAEELRGGQ
jgi:thiamine-phosphate pyrophosphorylase